ncbi:hypothetical protein GQ53DRAFT_742073 [Thozetella sp. PMI_491]|nr:hypothetical protein GQ53DRAFT_742073 [Thozetella sp. PMI_491]
MFPLTALLAALACLQSVVASEVTTQKRCTKSSSFHIPSPDGQLAANVSVSDSGIPIYEVYHGAEKVLSASSLGVVRLDDDFSGNMSLKECSLPEVQTEAYSLLHGKQGDISVDYMRSTCVFHNRNGSAMHLELAVSDTSFAFRYHFPRDKYFGARYVLAENTTFRLTTSANGSNYQVLQPYDSPIPKYQTFYQPRTSRERVRIGQGTSPTGFALPGLFKTTVSDADFYIHIKEAGFDGRYPGSHFSNASSGSNFALDFPDPADGNAMMGPVYGYSPLPWTLPWRIVTVGRGSAAPIIADTSVTDLSAPSQVQDTSFIKPGTSSWSWWSGPNNARNYTCNQEYIDLAEQQGWPYSLLDARWDKQTVPGSSEWVPLETVQDYSDARNVSLWVWMNSAGNNNNADITTKSPKDLLFQSEIRRDTLAALAEQGIVGLKIDGVQSDKQQLMAYLIEILRDAAAARLMVVFHNCPTPKGWERTWPNLLSSEALVASEFYADGTTENGSQMPENNVNQAFVRYPIGPADYSPGTFSRDLFPNDKLMTTDAHESALSIIIDSGLRIMPDQPSLYASKPTIAKLLGHSPFRWEKTVFLAGEPGKYFCVAKMTQDELYIAAINGESLSMAASNNVSDPTWEPAVGAARNLTVNLAPFLGNISMGAAATVVTDRAGSQDGDVTEMTLASILRNSTEIQIHMEPFGGYLARVRL